MSDNPFPYDKFKQFENTYFAVIVPEQDRVIHRADTRAEAEEFAKEWVEERALDLTVVRIVSLPVDTPGC